MTTTEWLVWSILVCFVGCYFVTEVWINYVRPWLDRRRGMSLVTARVFHVRGNWMVVRVCGSYFVAKIDHADDEPYESQPYPELSKAVWECDRQAAKDVAASN